MSKRNEPLTECIDAKGFEGTDISLITGLEWQRYALYCQIRKEMSDKYPKPEELREDEQDTINIEKARNDPKARVFTHALDDVHAALEKIGVLQALATEYEKKIIRFYAHTTRNWPEHGKDFLKLIKQSGLYELVEAYFKILRKYGLTTYEEPYYFLSPKQRRKIKFTGDMLKRTTQFDGDEIKVSILEDYQ